VSKKAVVAFFIFGILIGMFIYQVMSNTPLIITNQLSCNNSDLSNRCANQICTMQHYQVMDKWTLSNSNNTLFSDLYCLNLTSNASGKIIGRPD
jgi:hypothetical protein